MWLPLCIVAVRASKGSLLLSTFTGGRTSPKIFAFNCRKVQELSLTKKSFKLSNFWTTNCFTEKQKLLLEFKIKRPQFSGRQQKVKPARTCTKNTYPSVLSDRFVWFLKHLSIS